MSTRRQTTDHIATALTPLYESREARSIARTVVAELAGINLTDLLTDPGAALEIVDLDHLVARLAAGCPVQYVVGHTEFCGLHLNVGEGVLIPRPETEELVAWVVSNEQNTNAILDIGTGSGCIALALKNALPRVQVFAADISKAALAIATDNAHRLNLEVVFRQADALGNLAVVFPERFDAMVSNPPYVPQSDRAEMHPNVRDYEPGEALFVPDDDPLLFYRAIARTGRQRLHPGGRLYFEIYHLYADAMRRMLIGEGYTAIEIREDFAGKSRMVCCRMN